MAKFLGGVLLPLLLLTAALLNWSLISLIDLLTFIVIQYTAPKGLSIRRHTFVSWYIIIFSILAILSESIYLIIRTMEGEAWSTEDAWWVKLIGFVRVQSTRSSNIHICSFVIQLLVALVVLLGIYWYKFSLRLSRVSCWSHFSSTIEHLGYHLRVGCCILLPAVQLVVGISYPSWISLPFFICSCVGLVNWSLTSNFSGLFRWWRPLLIYSSFNIVLLYIYQLPVEFPHMFQIVANSIGLYKISPVMDWTQICCSFSLLLYYLMLSSIRCDLEDMDFIMSMRKSNLTEPLLPSKHSFLVRESRSGVRHTNVLLRGAVFRTFSINFFTYGFPW